MKEAMYYSPSGDKQVICLLCPHRCVIAPGKRGLCHVRENQDGKLYSLVYGMAAGAALDPVEKKPLYHFLPGHSSFSVSTVGCNMRCRQCQNWRISQSDDIVGEPLTPKQIVDLAYEQGAKSISYTYTEPTIFYEYALETARLAQKRGLRNIMVTNGYVNPGPRKKLYRHIDAANVDLKAFDDAFYRKVCSATLEPVLDTIKDLHSMGVWVELTNLIIPTLNDDMGKIREMCRWILDNVGPQCPLHFTAFYPCYKLLDLPPTSFAVLSKARSVAQAVGLKHVYVGNVYTDKMNSTFCHRCGELLIERLGFDIVKNRLINGTCSSGHKIDGVWD